MSKDAATLPDSGEPDGAVPELGTRLRSARHHGGLTLEATAARAGLSASYLSRVESGARAPSLPILLTLARIYATTVSALLGESASEDRPVIPAADAQPLHAHGWTYWRTGKPDRTMQALRIQVAAGADTGPDRIHPGEEWLYVLSGTLRLHLDGTAYRLLPGDAAHFDSESPHRIESATDDDVTLLMMHAPGPSPYRACIDHSSTSGAVR